MLKGAGAFTAWAAAEKKVKTLTPFLSPAASPLVIQQSCVAPHSALLLLKDGRLISSHKAGTQDSFHSISHKTSSMIHCVWSNSKPHHTLFPSFALLQVMYSQDKHSRPNVVETNNTSLELSLPVDQGYVIQIKPFSEGGEGISSRQITIPKISGETVQTEPCRNTLYHITTTHCNRLIRCYFRNFVSLLMSWFSLAQ